MKKVLAAAGLAAAAFSAQACPTGTCGNNGGNTGGDFNPTIDIVATPIAHGGNADSKSNSHSSSTSSSTSAATATSNNSLYSLSKGGNVDMSNFGNLSLKDVGNANASLQNSGNASIGSGAVVVNGPKIEFKDRLQAPGGFTGPAMPAAGGTVVYGGGSSEGQSPYEICARMPKLDNDGVGQAVWSGGLSIPGGGLNLGRTPPVALTDKCLGAVTQWQDDRFIARTGPEGTALILTQKLAASEPLQELLPVIRGYDCDDKVKAVMMGGCQVAKAPEAPTTEIVKNFGKAAQGVNQQDICPKGTIRANKPPIFNAQFNTYTCN